MEAGRALDERVAREVMGWTMAPVPDGAKAEIMNPALLIPRLCPPGEPWGVGYLMPRYSADITAAWLVVERFGDEPFDLYRRHEGWRASIGERIAQEGDTAPHAICLAALAAVGAAATAGAGEG